MNSRTYRLETSVIHVADTLINSIQLGSSSGDSIMPEFYEKIWDTFGLSSALIPGILEHIESQYKEVAEVFIS